MEMLQDVLWGIVFVCVFFCLLAGHGPSGVGWCGFEGWVQQEGFRDENCAAFFGGSYCSAMRLAMEEATHPNVARQERGWRLFLLLPRATLRNENWRVDSRFSQRGVGFLCYRRADKCVEASSTAQARKRRRDTQQDELERRAQRAHTLIQLGEVSAGRQALEGASLAPSNRRTLDALRDARRRPPRVKDPIPGHVQDHDPAVLGWRQVRGQPPIVEERCCCRTFRNDSWPLEAIVWQ